MTQTEVELDRIERSIDIEASAERVWELIARPGWWINEGEVSDDPDVRQDGDAYVVTHPTYGEFRIGTLRSEPPRELAYRWYFDGDRVGTTVEFRIEDGESGVTLRVVETGFSRLEKEHAEIVSHVAENTQGWEQELAAARRFVLGGRQ